MKTVAFSKTCFVTLILFYSSTIKTAGQSISGIINTYKKVTAFSSLTNTVTVPDVSGLAVGAGVLIIQMKGASIDETNTATFGNISPGNINGAGNYEYNTICTIAGNDVTLKYQLVNSYSDAGSMQLITVPKYNTVTVIDTLRSSPWSAASGTGGVIVMEADTIYLNSGISVKGEGFAGGALLNYPTPTYDCTPVLTIADFFLPFVASPSGPTGKYISGAPKGEGIANFITGKEYARGKQASGGGGGNNHNAGGGGGSNFGSGGNGGVRTTTGFNCTGPNPGVGGLSLASLGYSAGNNRVFLGGGGGSGHENNAVGIAGGNGGGIVLINANVIMSSGRSIIADGIMPFNNALPDKFTSGGDGAGGGGAGGTIILNVNQVNGSLNVSALGGNGANSGQVPLAITNDCPGPGGGGGGGVLWMKGSSPIANVSSSLNGGINGLISNLNPNVSCRNSAQTSTAGTSGNNVLNYIQPFSTPIICVPLPIPELKSFTGRIVQEGNALKWSMGRIENVAAYEIERSVDQVAYTTLIRRTNNGEFSFSFTDESNTTGTFYYRLKLTRTDNSVAYSSIVVLHKNITALLQWLDLMPNPATNQIKLTLISQRNMIAKMTIYNSTGQKVFSQQYRLSSGYTSITIPIIELQPGIHRIMIDVDGIHAAKTFIKSN